MTHSIIVTAPLGTGTVAKLKHQATIDGHGLLDINLNFCQHDFTLIDQVEYSGQLNKLRQEHPEKVTVLIDEVVAAMPLTLNNAVDWVRKITEAIPTANLEFIWVLGTSGTSHEHHRSYLQIAPLL